CFPARKCNSGLASIESGRVQLRTTAPVSVTPQRPILTDHRREATFRTFLAAQPTPLEDQRTTVRRRLSTHSRGGHARALWYRPRRATWPSWTARMGRRPPPRLRRRLRRPARLEGRAGRPAPHSPPHASVPSKAARTRFRRAHDAYRDLRR